MSKPLQIIITIILKVIKYLTPDISSFLKQVAITIEGDIIALP